MIKILVVDDHDLVRCGISRLLRDTHNIDVVGEAASGEDAIQFCSSLEPDIVLMDIRMPGIGGLEATRKILRSNPEIKIIAVTACDDTPYAGRFLNAGASGYLSKGAGTEEMVRAILKVMAGQHYISPEIAQKLALKPFTTDNTSPFEQLSERELQISMMIVNCQKVAEISQSLFLSPKTVNSYRYRIFDKLGINTDVELTHMAIRHGLIDPEIGR